MCTKKLAKNRLKAATILANDGLKWKTITNIRSIYKLAKYPTVATPINLKNCLYAGNLDAENTMYLVIIKLTTTPRKNDTASESV